MPKHVPRRLFADLIYLKLHYDWSIQTKIIVRKRILFTTWLNSTMFNCMSASLPDYVALKTISHTKPRDYVALELSVTSSYVFKWILKAWISCSVALKPSSSWTISHFGLHGNDAVPESPATSGYMTKRPWSHVSLVTPSPTTITRHALVLFL